MSIVQFGNACSPCGQAEEASPRRLRLLVLTMVSAAELCHGAGLRTRQLLAPLERTHELTRLCASDFPAPPPRSGVLARLRTALDFREPYPYQPELHQAIRQMLGRRRFDAVLVFGADLLRYLPSGEVPVLADLVDEPVLATWHELRAQRGLQRVRTLKNVASLVWYLRTYGRTAHKCFVVSERDADSLRRTAPGCAVEVLDNGVDSEYFRPAGVPVVSGEIVFSGNMSFPPNVAACHYFAREIFPRVLSGFSQAHWSIVGREPHESVRALAREGTVTVTGTVEDLRPHLERSAVVVSPMISGGGIKNKVLEAWSMGKAVVATTPGCAGVRARDGVNLLRRDSAEKFAEAAVHLLRNAQLASQLGEAGRSTVETEYAWNARVLQFERALQNAVHGRE